MGYQRPSLAIDDPGTLIAIATILCRRAHSRYRGMVSLTTEHAVNMFWAVLDSRVGQN